MDRMKETAVVEFINAENMSCKELEIPLDISADEMLEAVIQAFHLQAEPIEKSNGCLIAENPIAFLHGRKTLREYGIRNGSFIIYRRLEQ